MPHYPHLTHGLGTDGYERGLSVYDGAQDFKSLHGFAVGYFDSLDHADFGLSPSRDPAPAVSGPPKSRRLTMFDKCDADGKVCKKWYNFHPTFSSFPQSLPPPILAYVASHSVKTQGLIVLGMHRSSTSLLTGLLSDVLGYGVGPEGELIGAAFDNPKGEGESEAKVTRT